MEEGKKELTLREVADILLKNDIRTIESYIAKGWIPEIAYDKSNMAVDAVILAEKLGVKNFDEPFINETEARGILNLSAKVNIISFFKKKGINMYRLANITGSTYLFRKSDLMKHIELKLELIPYGIEGSARKNTLESLVSLFPAFAHLVKIERGVKILKAYIEGGTMEEIGKGYDFTRERTRQILEATKKNYIKVMFKISKWMRVFESTEYATMEPERIIELLEEGKRLKKENAVLREHINQNNNSGESIEQAPVEQILAKVELLEKPIKEFDISVRTLNILKSADIKNLNDLKQYSASDVMKFRGAGPIILAEIVKLLEQNGEKLNDKNIIN